MLDRRVAIAPMMARTDRHCRYLMRLLAPHILLYTEMVTTGALLYGDDPERFLGFSRAEHPVALQLGGSDPHALAKCAEMAQQWGYDEVNLNVGCPSNRVQSAQIGACLMAKPQLVGECIAAMQSAVTIPVTVKTRIGIDHQDSYTDLKHFIESVAQWGCRVFIIHARKAWLNGLSPKANRNKPPLNYEHVYQLKNDYPKLSIVINGGIDSTSAANSHLHHVDGVMIGRYAYEHPYELAKFDRMMTGGNNQLPRRETVIREYITYMKEQMAQGNQLHHMTQHLLNLLKGQPKARLWRRYITETVSQTQDPYLIEKAMELCHLTANKESSYALT